MFRTNHFKLLIFLFLIVYTCVSVSAQQKTFTLDGKKGSVSTGINIQKGDIIKIESSGQITLGILAGKSMPCSMNSNDFTLESMTNSLLGKKSDPQKYFLDKKNPLGHLLMKIGSSPYISTCNYTGESAYSGSLIFYLNDNDLKNNSGSYSITVNITKSSSNSTNNQNNSQGNNKQNNNPSNQNSGTYGGTVVNTNFGNGNGGKVTGEKKESHTFSWDVKNSGTKVWDMNSIKIVADALTISNFGAEKNSNLSKNVQPGETITITKKVSFPDKSGNFNGSFSLNGDNKVIVTLKFTVEIKEQKTTSQTKQSTQQTGKSWLKVGSIVYQRVNSGKTSGCYSVKIVELLNNNKAKIQLIDSKFGKMKNNYETCNVSELYQSSSCK